MHRSTKTEITTTLRDGAYSNLYVVRETNTGYKTDKVTLNWAGMRSITLDSGLYCQFSDARELADYLERAAHLLYTIANDILIDVVEDETESISDDYNVPEDAREMGGDHVL